MTQPLLHVTSHALERYRCRVADVSTRQAYLALTSDLIRQAALTGMSAVILPSGHKVILRGAVVVTVKPKSCHKRNRGFAAKG